MSNFAPSTNHNFAPATAEAERRYREELIGRTVDQAQGKVMLYTTMDLSPEERRTVNASFAERHAASGQETVAATAPEQGGWQEYGEVSAVSALQRPGIKDLVQLNRISAPETGSVENNEKAVFYTDENGNEFLVYQMSGFYDDTGRSGNVVTIGLPIEAGTAQELYDGALRDPSLLDDIALAQLEAFGLGKRGTDFFRFQHGPTERNRKNTWYDQKERVKSIFRRGSTGSVEATQVAYATKQPLDVPGHAIEQLAEPMSQTPETPVYDVEANVAANKIRSEVQGYRDRGISSAEIAVELWGQRLAETDPSAIAAQETVYSEVLGEAVSPKEIDMLVSEVSAIKANLEPGEDLEEKLADEIENTIEFALPDGVSVDQMIQVLMAHSERLSDARTVDGSADDSALYHKATAISIAIERLEAKRKKEG